MKLEYDLVTGELGAFGENINSDNFVTIDESIKAYILTNNVKFNVTLVTPGQIINTTDVFLPREPQPLQPSLEDRLESVESAITALMGV